MEKPVNEDFNLGWPVMRAMIFVIIGLSLLAGLQGGLITHDFKFFLFTVGVSVFLFVSGRFLRNRIARSSRPDTWVLTDAGLQRVYSDPAARELISWNSIERMRWIRFKGLLFFWNESGSRCESFRDEFQEGNVAGLYRGLLHVPEQDADEIAKLWLNHHTSNESETVPGPTRHRARRPMSRESRHVLFLFLALGLGLIGWDTVNLLRHYASARWPVVQGKIVSQFYLQPTNARHSGKHEKLHLTYRYEVGGQAHYASQYSLARADYSGFSDDVRGVADAYPVGAAVQVHYNPGNPAEAVLHSGPDWTNDGAFLVLGGLFVFLSLVFSKIMVAQDSRREVPEKNWLLKVYGNGQKKKLRRAQHF